MLARVENASKLIVYLESASMTDISDHRLHRDRPDLRPYGLLDGWIISSGLTY